MVLVENSFLPTYMNLEVFTQVIFICWVFINAFLSWFLFCQWNPPINRRTTMIPMTLFPPKIDNATPLTPAPAVPLTTDRRGDSWFLENFLQIQLLPLGIHTTAEDQRYQSSPCSSYHNVPFSISWIKWQCFIGNFCATILFSRWMSFSVLCILKRDQEDKQSNLGNRSPSPLGSLVPH